MDRTNQFFVVNKHNIGIRGKKARKWSRKFYDNADQAFEIAKLHAQDCVDDFLVVQVVSEASRPKPVSINTVQKEYKNNKKSLPMSSTIRNIPLDSESVK